MRTLAASLAPLSLALALGGCAPAATPAARAPSPPVAFAVARAGSFHSARFELSLPLPDGSAWRIDDHRSPWLVARHEATRSTLRVRAWSEPEVVRHASCEARARGFAPDLPQPDTARVVDDRYLALDGDLAAHLVTAVAPAPGERDLLEGSVLLVAADVHRCLVLSYVTLAAGDGAPAVLGERLAVIAEATAKGLRRDRELSGAAPPRERR